VAILPLAQITTEVYMNQGPVEFSSLSIDEELRLLESELHAFQRIWLIERTKSGVWGIAVIHDLPEHKWPAPNEHGYIPDSDKWETIAYRRHENLAKAIRDVREDIILRNNKEAEESLLVEKKEADL
jgi:hypothetical protein